MDVYFKRMPQVGRTPSSAGRPRTDALGRLGRWSFADRLNDTQRRVITTLAPLTLRDTLQLHGDVDVPESKQTVADLLAHILTASVAGVGGNKRLLPKEAVTAALKLLLDLMPDAECELLSPESFKKLAYTPNLKVIAVLGCQTPALLDSRVIRAHRLAEDLRGDVTFVLSGKHPPRPTVTILNESEHMAVTLEGLAARGTSAHC